MLLFVLGEKYHHIHTWFICGHSFPDFLFHCLYVVQLDVQEREWVNVVAKFVIDVVPLINMDDVAGYGMVKR